MGVKSADSKDYPDRESAKGATDKVPKSGLNGMDKSRRTIDERKGGNVYAQLFEHLKKRLLE